MVYRTTLVREAIKALFVLQKHNFLSADERGSAIKLLKLVSRARILFCDEEVSMLIIIAAAAVCFIIYGTWDEVYYVRSHMFAQFNSLLQLIKTTATEEVITSPAMKHLESLVVIHNNSKP